MNPRTVLITGSTQGIGLGIAESFAKAGWRVVLNAHLEDAAAEAARTKIGALTEVHFVQADVSSPAACERLLAKARGLVGNIDCLVNNAGTFQDSPFGTLTESQFQRTFDLNVKGMIFTAQAFVNGLTGHEKNPSILCVGSSNSFAAESDSVLYDASKGAVLMLIKSLAASLSGKGIRVNGVAPGIVRTPLTQGNLAREGVEPYLKQQIPLGRIGDPTEIGPAAVFLAGEGAVYITGHMLTIDGGILAVQTTWGA